MKSSWIMESLTPRARHSSKRLVLKVVDGVGKAHAQRQMAGGVLVEQRVVEQQAGLADGAVVGHQGALAQIGSCPRPW